MELILVRHGEPLHDPSAQIDADDPPLSARGARQALRVADWITRAPLHAVITSPARRAQETARATALRLGLVVTPDPRLRDVAPRDGRYVPIEEDRIRDPDRYRARLADYGDSTRAAQVAARVVPALEDWALRHAGERIAVFCHGTIVNVFAAHVLGLDRAALFEPHYASGHRFLISSSGVRSVASLNETAFLDE